MYNCISNLRKSDCSPARREKSVLLEWQDRSNPKPETTTERYSMITSKLDRLKD